MKQFYQNKTTLELTPELIKLKEAIRNTKFLKISKSYATDTAKKWIAERNVKLNKIPFIEMEKILKGCNENNCSLNEVINIYKNYLNPINVPIIREDKKFDYGQFTPIYLDDQGNDLIFTEFRLSKFNTYITPIVYLHEIIHSIIENNKNSINDFIDYELCPIIFELLMANDLDQGLYYLILNSRLHSLESFIEILELGDTLGSYYASSYIKSILLATEFMKKYIKSSNNTQMEMFAYLQNILDDNATAYSMLEKYDVSYNSALNKILKRGDVCN